MPLTLVPLVDELYKQYRLPRSVAAEEDLLYFVEHTTRTQSYRGCLLTYRIEGHDHANTSG